MPLPVSAVTTGTRSFFNRWQNSSFAARIAILPFLVQYYVVRRILILSAIVIVVRCRFVFAVDVKSDSMDDKCGDTLDFKFRFEGEHCFT